MLKKGVESCGNCKEFPCTILIQFTFDPVWRTHLVCIENLKRRKKIGTEAWLKEQEKFWRENEKYRKRMVKTERRV